MSTRYTAADVTEALAELIEQAGRYGIDASSWLLNRGDARMGSPYLLWGVENGHRVQLVNLGTKPREAVEKIIIMGHGIRLARRS